MEGYVPCRLPRDVDVAKEMRPRAEIEHSIDHHQWERVVFEFGRSH